MTSTEPDPPPASVALARQILGPLSAALVATDPGAAAVRRRLDAGAELQDAVLGAVHAAAARDRALASEFLAHFEPDLQRVAEQQMSGPLRAFTEPDDLRQSVATDLLEYVWELEFTTRGAFVALLARRMGWKIVDRARERDRRPDLPGGEEPADPPDAGSPGPLSVSVRREDRAGLVRLLLRLSRSDAELLRWVLEGVPMDEVARRRGVSLESAERLVRRARERARDLLAGGAGNGD